MVLLVLMFNINVTSNQKWEEGRQTHASERQQDAASSQA